MTQDRNKRLDRLLAGALRGAEPTDHPDAELLASYFEKRLAGGERATTESHLSTCSRCRAVLFDLARLAEADAPERRSFWSRLFTAPAIGAFATATIAAVLAIRLFPDTQQHEFSETQTAPVAQSRPAERAGADTDDYAAEPAPPASADEKQVFRAGEKKEKRALDELEAAKPAAAPPALRKDGELRDEEADSGRRAREYGRAEPSTRSAMARDAREGQPQAKLAAPTPPPATEETFADRAGGLGAAAPQYQVEEQERAANERAKTDELRSEPAPAGAAAMARAPARNQVTALERHDHAAEMPRVLWRTGSGGTIERSDDGGSSWAVVGTGVAEKIGAVMPVTPSVVWAVGEKGIVLRTLDGRTWTRLPKPTDEDLVTVYASSPDTATVTTRSGQSFETHAGGSTWTAR